MFFVWFVVAKRTIKKSPIKIARSSNVVWRYSFVRGSYYFVVLLVCASTFVAVATVAPRETGGSHQRGLQLTARCSLRGPPFGLAFGVSFGLSKALTLTF